MSWYQLVVAALATNQAVEIWHHSVLFDDWKQRRLQWLITVDNPSWLSLRWRQLLACPWCLSVWVAAGLLLWLWWADSQWIWSLPVYALATSRAANLINDLAYSFLRTPKISHETLVEENDV